METGTVKWFNNAKGYGFITPSEGGQDLFVHMSNIVMEGYKTLAENQEVDYKVGDQAMIFLRQNFYKFSDPNFSYNQLQGTETMLELKINFN